MKLAENSNKKKKNTFQFQVQDETQTSENLEEVKETNVEMVEDKLSPDKDVSGSQLEEAQEAENEQKRLENERELQEAEEKRKIEEKEKKNLEAKRKCEEEEVNKPSMTDVKENRRLTRAERATKKAKVQGFFFFFFKISLRVRKEIFLMLLSVEDLVL